MVRIYALGKVAVPAHGTPVNLLTAFVAAFPNVVLPAYNGFRKVEMRQYSGNTGKVYVGGAGLNVAAATQLIGELEPSPASGQNDRVEVVIHEGDYADLSAISVDSAVNNEGPLVTVYV